MRISVVLPAPFGPSRPKTMPSGTSRSTPARAVVEPNRLTTPPTRTAGGPPRRDPLVSAWNTKPAPYAAATQTELAAKNADLLEGKVVVDPSSPIGIDENGEMMRPLPDDESAGCHD